MKLILENKSGLFSLIFLLKISEYSVQALWYLRFPLLGFCLLTRNRLQIEFAKPESPLPLHWLLFSVKAESGYYRILGLESDEEIRRVPEIGVETAGTSVSRPDAGSGGGPVRVQGTGEGPRKRGRNPADKESKRLKRYVSWDGRV